MVSLKRCLPATARPHRGIEGIGPHTARRATAAVLLGLGAVCIAAYVVHADTHFINSLLGDKDGFGLGLQPGDESASGSFDERATSDPVFTDSYPVLYPCTADFSYVHSFSLSGTIVAARLGLLTMGIQDGDSQVYGSDIEIRVFIDSVEIPGALDDVDQFYHNGTEWVATVGVVSLAIPPDLFGYLGDGEVEVSFVNRNLLDPGRYDAFAIDFSELVIETVETPATFRVDGIGQVLADGAFYASEFSAGSADVAEWVPVTHSVCPGDVLVLDTTNPGFFRRSEEICSALTAGAVSTQPGVILGQAEAFEQKALLALAGIVPVKVTDEGGPIQPGDLLVTSSTPGHAMRWAGPHPCPCALVGKALEPMADESGLILVLLTSH